MITLHAPITPCLWFDGEAEQAAKWYISLFADSRIVRTTRWGANGVFPEGTALTVDFELGGRPFTALNGGPEFHFDEAISFVIEVADQSENEQVWEILTTDGGREGQCGWLTDRFGISWQVAPTLMATWLTSGDADGIARVMQAMMPMTKLDIPALQAAFEHRS